MEKLLDLFAKFLQDYPSLLFTIVGLAIATVVILIALFAIVVLRSDDGISIGPISFRRKSPLDAGQSAKSEISNLNKTTSIKPISSKSSRDVVLNNLKDKIIRLQGLHREIQKVPFVLIGSTYVDLVVAPVSTRTLCAEEWSDLEAPKMVIGGSAMCVGRYLWADFGIKSHLLTPVSDLDDPFSSEFRRLLKEEEETWLIPDGLVKTQGRGTPITVILKQLDKTFTTMFTYRGALSTFGWTDVSSSVQKLLQPGGVLYVSGFTKTNLSLGLVDHLSAIHNNALVILDHGRINLRTDNPNTLRALLDAFSSGCIDISICTLREIIDFYHAITGRAREYDLDNARALLEDIAKTEILPPVTIIRTNIGDQSVSAYSIISGVVDSIPDHSRRFFDGTPVAPLNAFNAAIVNSFLSEKLDPATDFRGYVINIAQKGLSSCHKRRENDPSRI
jgi:hypothetical protein